MLISTVFRCLLSLRDTEEKKMIKLIASDLDGTLLYGRGNSVSEEMFEMIR